MQENISWNLVGQSENLKFVGNKGKGLISKRVFQESKARQFFRKKWLALFSRGTRFEIRHFALITDELKFAAKFAAKALNGINGNGS